jgi:hypothetical protein
MRHYQPDRQDDKPTSPSLALAPPDEWWLHAAALKRRFAADG